MKQVSQTQRRGQVRVTEVPDPVLRPSGVLVRTACSLISAGTERAKVKLAQKSMVGKAMARPEQAAQLRKTIRQQGPLATYRKVMNRLEALQPLGYSCAGVVLEVGDAAGDFRPGDPVACAGAGYANHAEINFIPQNLCVPVPRPGSDRWRAIGLDEAAFATVGAIAMQGFRQADVRLGEVVGVLGLGLIGLLVVQIAKAAGCHVVGLDPNQGRCRLARDFGADYTVSDAAALLNVPQAMFGVPGCDAVVVTAATESSEPTALAGRLCRPKGKVVVVGAVGLNVPRQVYYAKELDLRLSCSYGPGRYDPNYEEKGQDYPITYVRWTEKRNMQAFLECLAEGTVKVRPLITHRFRIENATAAYELIAGATEPYLGVLLEYPPTDGSATSPRDSAVAPAVVAKAAPVAACERIARSLDGPLCVSFIGAGNFAQDTLIPALQSIPGVRLYSVTTSSGLSARSVANRAGFQQPASSAAEVLADPGVHVIVVATRHNLHAPLVCEALRHGKPVFVEKPLALSREELAQVVEAYGQAASNGAPLLMVGFNRRFAPAVQAVKRFLAGSLEPAVMHYRVNAGYIPPSHWVQDTEIGGGRILGEACHFMDLLLYLAGAPPVEIFAQALPDQGRYRGDNVAVQVRFANGSLATLHYLANGDRQVAKERLEVFSGGAVAVIDDFRHTWLARAGRLQRIGGRWAAPDKGHRTEMRAFMDAVRSGGPAPIPFQDLVRTTAATLDILQSLRTGRPVVFHNED